MRQDHTTSEYRWWWWCLAWPGVCSLRGLLTSCTLLLLAKGAAEEGAADLDWTQLWSRDLLSANHSSPLAGDAGGRRGSGGGGPVGRDAATLRAPGRRRYRYYRHLAHLYLHIIYTISTHTPPVLVAGHLAHLYQDAVQTGREAATATFRTV